VDDCIAEEGIHQTRSFWRKAYYNREPTMATKRIHGLALLIVVTAMAVGAIGVVVLRYGLNAGSAPTALAKPQASGLVDQQPLITAQRLAALATTGEEREFAQNALRLADHEVDLAFAAALHQASEHAAPIPAAARPILARVHALQDRVKAEQKDVSRLKQLVEKVDDNRKVALEEQLQLQTATLEVDQEDLDAASQELIRAGGDPKNKIQQLMEQHEALGHDQTATAGAASPVTGKPASASAPSPEAESRTFLVQLRDFRQMEAKEVDLAAAREELRTREAELAQEHHLLGQQSGDAKPAQPDERSSSDVTPSVNAEAVQHPASPEVLAKLKKTAEERKYLAGLDKRAADFQQLDSLYKQWDAFVQDKKRDYLKGVIEGGAWIFVLLLLVLFAGPLVHFLVARLAPESRLRHTIRVVARVAIQVVGICLILLVAFGPPGQLATVVALAGAGLTVALKDFIVGFFGWFILMGRNGIRPGDWVEINGIGGEVVEVGLLHTVILETGDWSDAGHPTGRKVTFVNSFAIEGHYFNFSTTGQWLWDEVEVPIPAGVDPYPIAESVHKTVMEETQANMRLAEQEWQRAVPSHVGRTFSPAPAIMVRPTTLGVSVIVRYITRANERHEVRSRLFHRIVGVLRSQQVTAGPLEARAAQG
jgi:small-conductance mechanosensitive channel